MKKYINSNILNRIMENKRFPLNSNPHIGIEIECITNFSRSQMSYFFALKNLQNYVSVGTDMSIEVGRELYEGSKIIREYGHEIRICCPYNKLKETLNKVCSVIKFANGTVNDSCGLHVHLDMRFKKPYTSYWNLVSCLPLLKSKVSKHRWNNEYCKLNRTKLFGEVNNEHDKSGEKYYAVNKESYKRLKTLEIRIHESTLNPNKIFNWVKLLVDIAKVKKKISSQVKNVRELSQYV